MLAIIVLAGAQCFRLAEYGLSRGPDEFYPGRPLAGRFFQLAKLLGQDLGVLANGGDVFDHFFDGRGRLEYTVSLLVHQREEAFDIPTDLVNS